MTILAVHLSGVFEVTIQMESFFLPGSKIILVQALISIYLICGVFYLSQWLFADFLLSMKERRNMKELGDLILTSSLLFAIVCCHFPYTSELNWLIAQKWTETTCLLKQAAHSSLLAAKPILKLHPR